MSEGLRIPRILHRIWLGGPMPEREQALGETWASHHPGWEMRLWHEGNLPTLRNATIFASAASYAQQADVLRYEVLLEHGGVYVDTDFECLRSLEPLLVGVEAFTAREDELRASIGILGCVPGHPFFAAVVAALPDSVAWRPGRPPNEQTGPELLTRTLLACDVLGEETLTVFPPQLFYPYHWTEPHRAGESFPDAYAVHHWSASWHAPTVPHQRRPGSTPAPAPTAVEPPLRVLVEIDPDLLEVGSPVLVAAVEALAASAPHLAGDYQRLAEELSGRVQARLQVPA